MRFDDMIATVLERPSARADQRAAQWRQLVDLLAQGRDGGATEQVDRAYQFLRRHRDEVPLVTRERTAAALTGLPIDARMIALFGEDHPSVSSALLRGARLDAEGWISVLPALTPTGRAILRHRRDLPREVGQALKAFGPTDFVIEGHVAAEAKAKVPERIEPAVPIDEGSSQIRELVERIEAFQKHREESDAHAPAARIEEFRWETGPEGVILWIDGAPRGPLVGQSIAAIAGRGQFGVDGQAAGAFHKRAPFRDARLTVAGEGAAAGGWRISGVPYFDMHRGTFRGYRGTARRPRFDEVASIPVVDEAPAGLFGTGLAPDALRQLMHELRTPLNAIIGFAEMIEGQYMGPAGGVYRGRAADIVGQAQRLLGAVDDLDEAARIETTRPDLLASEVDAGALLSRLHRACVREAEAQSVAITLRVEPDLPPIAVDASAAERMFARLMAATIGLAGPGETIAAAMRRAGDNAPMVELAIGRPRSIAGLEEPQLLHPGYSPEGDWPGAPALGLGFALRLVRKLAEAAGGGLNILDDSFVLSLPASGMARRDDEESA
jgi:hypothetical protein